MKTEHWRCARIESDSLVDLDAAITKELRGLRSTGTILGLLDVDDEFFVLLRPTPGGVALMVSDAAAAFGYDVAADVLDLLRVDLPPDDDALDDVSPEGDLGILADLGLPAGRARRCSRRRSSCTPTSSWPRSAAAAGSPTPWPRSSTSGR